MKNTLIISTFNCIFYLCLIGCSDDNISTLEGLKISEDELYFSFDKENFNNFKCNISEETFNQASLSKEPFGFDNPLGNFINTFCLFYQHSQVKHDKNFEAILKNLFDFFCDGIYDSNNTEFTFEDYLSNQVKRIKKILNEQNILHQLVKVKENEGRIICTCNNLNKERVVEVVRYDISTTEKKVEYCTIEFFDIFNILFLEGSLESGYFDSLEKLNSDYIKEKINQNSLSHKILFTELISLYTLLNRLLRNRYEYLSFFNEENICEKFCTEYLKNYFSNETKSFTRRNLKSNAIKSINFYKGKVTAKIFSDYSENLDAFCSYPDLYKDTVFEINKYVKKIFEGTDLSDKSILSLTVQCIEFEV